MIRVQIEANDGDQNPAVNSKSVSISFSLGQKENPQQKKICPAKERLDGYAPVLRRLGCLNRACAPSAIGLVSLDLNNLFDKEHGVQTGTRLTGATKKYR